MATDLKISELTAYETPIDNDLIPMVDTTTNTTKKVTWGNAKTDTLRFEVPTTSEVVGANLVTDPNYGEWTDGLPDHHTVEILGVGGAVEEDQTPANVYAGTSSAKLIGSTSGEGPGGATGTVLTGLTPGDVYRISTVTKCGTAVRAGAVYGNAASVATVTQSWDVNTKTWVETMEVDTLTESTDWEESSEDYIPAPASGIINVFIYAEGTVETPNATAWVGEVTIEKVTRPSTTSEILNFAPLCKIEGVNFGEIGQGAIPLFPVPTGYKLIIATMYVEATEEVGTIDAPGTYSLGTEAPYTNIMAEADNFPETIGHKIDMHETGDGINQQYLAQGGETVYFKLITEWDVTGEAIGTIYLWGALIKVES